MLNVNLPMQSFYCCWHIVDTGIGSLQMWTPQLATCIWKEFSGSQTGGYKMYWILNQKRWNQADHGKYMLEMQLWTFQPVRNLHFLCPCLIRSTSTVPSTSCTVQTHQPLEFQIWWWTSNVAVSWCWHYWSGLNIYNQHSHIHAIWWLLPILWNSKSS